MELETIYQYFLKYPSIITDSRQVKPGTIYVALRGERFDGNAFAAQALQNGAALVIIDNEEFYVDERTVLVKDSLETLQQLANYHRRQLGIPILGITGTNGKTTTKELIRCVLERKFKLWATQGNLNNHIGVPLTLLSMNANTEFGIVEMGANHPYEIEQLCKIAEPDFGLITNIGKAHLEGFGGFQGVIKTKKELYDYLVENKGIVFYNSDNELLAGLAGQMDVKKVSYGAMTGELCRGHVVSSDPFLEGDAEIKSDAGVKKIQLKSKLVGSYNFENILAAVCVGTYFGVPESLISKAIEEYTPTNNRSQLTITAKNRLLLDCYNANPSSTEAAILNFASIKADKKVVILGDMLELGDEARNEHDNILKILATYADIQVLLVGKWYQELSVNYGFTAFLTVDELNKWLDDNPVGQSFVLVKGSRGIQLEKVLGKL
ncbi:MAG: UDP-N-acetylmuramoyl-tripeptide--D-alanyl-D-alanine ligase [Bacteroidota bacterium]|nr:UDP-N-acetylmuramoyl-tripeptide--D-alanyl-D-alanine ligase [Bacteroidota bacterium]